MQVAFRPETIFKKEGSIVIKVPAWYDMTSTIYSTESMLGPKSKPSFKAPNDFEVVKFTWDTSARSMVIEYKGPNDIDPNSKKIVLEITEFKTPVNQYTRRGF